MIELLVVIAIISILASMFMGVVFKTLNQVNVVKISTEIGQMAMALEDFKSRHGVYPPSMLRLREDGNYRITAPDIDPLDVYTVSYLRRLFPGINVGLNNPPYTGPMSEARPGIDWHDWNGDRRRVTNVGFRNDGGLDDLPQTFILEGDELLVYFLAGLIVRDGSGRLQATGFCTDTTRPTIPSPLNVLLADAPAVAPANTSANRTIPYDFDTRRLVPPNPRFVMVQANNPAAKVETTAQAGIPLINNPYLPGDGTFLNSLIRANYIDPPGTRQTQRWVSHTHFYVYLDPLSKVREGEYSWLDKLNFRYWRPYAYWVAQPGTQNNYFTAPPGVPDYNMDGPNTDDPYDPHDCPSLMDVNCPAFGSTGHFGLEREFVTPYYQARTGGVIGYVRPDKFQILSAGKDRVYGVGGPYPLSQAEQTFDSDNMTNFAQGQMGSGK